MICASDMSKRDRIWDVLIVGAGVAGAMAASRLAQLGLSVLLIDKAAFPRAKACGCCLNHSAVGLLTDAGLDVRALGAVPVNRFELACSGTTVTVPTPPGLAVSREILDVALIRHAEKAGAVFMSGAPAVSTQTSADYRVVDGRHNGIETSWRARVVLVADGLGGRLLKDSGGVHIAAKSRVGLAGTLEHTTDFYAPGNIYMACGKRGYAGLVMVENGRLHIAAALDCIAAQQAAGAGNAVAEIIREAGLPVPASLGTCRWYGAPALTRRRHRLFEQRLFILGDAAGYVEPFSGEGMAWALASASRVVPLVSAGVQAWRPELGRQWELQHRKLIGSRQRMCRVLTLLLRNAGLTRVAIEALQLSPALASPLVRRINRPFILA